LLSCEISHGPGPRSLEEDHTKQFVPESLALAFV